MPDVRIKPRPAAPRVVVLRDAGKGNHLINERRLAQPAPGPLAGDEMRNVRTVAAQTEKTEPGGLRHGLIQSEPAHQRERSMHGNRRTRYLECRILR